MKTFPLILLFLLLYSCSPKVTRIATSADKANFGITNPSKAVFFVENEKIAAPEDRISDHKIIADLLYKQLGGATDRLMVARTNAKTFKFSNGTVTWFVDVEVFPKRTAMILFNGKNEPVIEYNPKNYERIVKTQLSNELKTKQKSDNETQIAKKEALGTWNTMESVPFKTDQKYADRIINHSNTIYYPLLNFEDGGNCNGQFTNIIYSDEKQQKVSYTANLTYRNGKMLEYRYSREGVERIQKYYLNKVNLLDSIVTTENGKREMKLNFKYLPDQFTIHSSYGDREEFHLNTKGQVDIKYDFDKENKMKREIHYTYDNLGRVLKEESMSKGESPVTNTYQYDSDTRKMYSKMIIQTKEGKILSENVAQIMDGKHIFTSIADGKVQSKSVSTLTNHCEGKVITYDGSGKVLSVSVQERR